MTSNDGQKPLQAFTSGLDDLIGEPIGKDFAWERRDVDACRFAFEDIAECFEVRVASTDEGVAKLESWDVGLYW